jgi:hypothetical protein
MRIVIHAIEQPVAHNLTAVRSFLDRKNDRVELAGKIFHHKQANRVVFVRITQSKYCG